MKQVACLLIALSAAAQDAEVFEKKIRPLFAAKCSACHGAKTKMGGLDLSSPASIASVVTKNDPEQSRLYHALQYTEKVKMPPSGKLAGEEIALVKSWIEAGAAMPSVTSVRAGGVTEEDRKHWAFQPVARPAIPVVKNASWAKSSPIDTFILAKLEEKGLTPAPPASKLTLLRRVTYDLIGLPPAPDEIDAFVTDTSPDAFSKVVDRLLASPLYGERWGRHWLDVARFAESTGMDEDNPYPYAWRYRDYVVKAFNEDRPYDRFVQEQIAGDLLPRPEIVATGFLAIGPRPLAQQDRMQMIYDVVDEQIDTVSKAFMGLTVACARCHDHKFDPILTKDYYGLASIFASSNSFRNHGRPGAISYMYYVPLDPAAHGLYEAHRVRTLAKRMEMEDTLAEDLNRANAPLRPKVGEFLKAAWNGTATEKWAQWLKSNTDKPYLQKLREATQTNIDEVVHEYQEQYSKSAAKWDEQLERWRNRFSKESLQDRALPDRPKFNAETDPFFEAATFNGGPMELPESSRVQLLRAEWKQLEETMPKQPEYASAVTDGVSVDQHVFVRGDLHSPGEKVAKHFPVVIAGEQAKPIAKGSGRLELAQWLTSPEHPLTARVMVNRIWQWHFGEALMRTPNNWGKTGEKPSHPELLDYLAYQFVEGGWSIKSMHRAIVLSNTYRMSTAPSSAADPGNRLFSRFNRVRMSVEQIRDSLLFLDGSLDSTQGGTIFPPGSQKRPKFEIDEFMRRTIYIPVKRGSIQNLLSTFDFGDATTSNEGRSRTNVAPQALFMMNSKFVLDRSQGIAKRLLDDATLTDSERIARAYRTILTRVPAASETDAALSYISSLEKRLASADARDKAWQSFCHILVSTNEFLYLN